MKGSLRGALVGLVGLIGLVSACGATPRPSVQAPEGAVGAQASTPASPRAVAVPPPPPAPERDATATVSAAASAVATEGSQRDAVHARADLVSAQRDLDASAGSCAAACRALGSMDRAAGRLCGLVASPADARICDDSRGKLVAARERVRRACGSCPKGPTVDPDAPAPTPSTP